MPFKPGKCISMVLQADLVIAGPANSPLVEMGSMVWTCLQIKKGTEAIADCKYFNFTAAHINKM